MKELILTKNLEDMTMIGSWLFQKSAKTQKYYRRVLGHFLEFFPGITLKAVEITHLALFLKAYGNHSDSTRNTYKNALSSFFSFAAKAGYLPRNPALALDNLKTPDRIYSKVLSREQVEQMVLKEPIARNRLIIQVLYLTGLRVEELCSLKRSSFHSSNNGWLMVVEGKGRKVRSLHLPEALVLEIQNHLMQVEGEFLFSNLKNTFGVFRPLNPSQVFRIIKAAAKRAKLSVAPSPHWLRHTSATHAIEAGAPIHVVQRSLGHESISTTGKYLDIRPKESVGDYLKPLWGLAADNKES